MTKQETLQFIRLGYSQLYDHSPLSTTEDIKLEKELSDAQRINKSKFTLLGVDSKYLIGKSHKYQIILKFFICAPKVTHGRIKADKALKDTYLIKSTSEVVDAANPN